LAIGILAGFGSSSSYAIDSFVEFATKEITSYPFFANPERASTIQTAYVRVVTLMTPAEVKAILGEPDEIRPLYEPAIKNPKVIGHTYWYVIRRRARDGSANEKDESLVRVSFDLADRVSHIDHWGFSKSNGQ
jgi:hypothetical protein